MLEHSIAMHHNLARPERTGSYHQATRGERLEAQGGP